MRMLLFDVPSTSKSVDPIEKAWFFSDTSMAFVILLACSLRSREVNAMGRLRFQLNHL